MMDFGNFNQWGIKEKAAPLMAFPIIVLAIDG
jgi:hypothetical protein